MISSFCMSKMLKHLNITIKDILIKLILHGGYSTSFAWPLACAHETIPIIWGCWPRSCPRFPVSFRRVRYAFTTASYVVAFGDENFRMSPVSIFPKGVATAGYMPSKALAKHRIDLGTRSLDAGPFTMTFARQNQWLGATSFPGPSEGLLFLNFNSLCSEPADAKPAASFPLCDTHPAMAGSVKTLAQRYRKRMPPRIPIIGRGPRELIDLLGYDPVTRTDPGRPAQQIAHILRQLPIVGKSKLPRGAGIGSMRCEKVNIKDSLRKISGV